LDDLRALLLDKREEILALKATYQSGILELEEDAARWIRGTRTEALSEALKSREVELLLHSIQRRHAYRNGLDKPLDWTDRGSEELLFMRRRAFFDLQLQEAAEGLDMQPHLIEIDSAMKRYQPTAEGLSIDTAALLPPSIDRLWKRLVEQSRLIEMTPEDVRNQEIINEACSGDLRRISDLTGVTLKGARCLAESNVRELFLNRLNDLPPAAARLCEWPGNWLCLNGIRRLSPDAAQRLFAWPGSWISLNGLDDLTIEAAGHLLGWKCRQLELMGLRNTTAIEYLARWEQAGGRLFVPGKIRREIDRYLSAGAIRPPAMARR
jgi:hypothetical protein